MGFKHHKRIDTGCLENIAWRLYQQFSPMVNCQQASNWFPAIFLYIFYLSGNSFIIFYHIISYLIIFYNIIYVQFVFIYHLYHLHAFIIISYKNNIYTLHMYIKYVCLTFESQLFRISIYFCSKKFVNRQFQLLKHKYVFRMCIYMVFRKNCYFSSKNVYYFAPLQHWTPIGCSENGQPKGETVHSHCVENF